MIQILLITFLILFILIMIRALFDIAKYLDNMRRLNRIFEKNKTYIEYRENLLK